MGTRVMVQEAVQFAEEGNYLIQAAELASPGETQLGRIGKVVRIDRETMRRSLEPRRKSNR